MITEQQARNALRDLFNQHLTLSDKSLNRLIPTKPKNKLRSIRRLPPLIKRKHYTVRPRRWHFGGGKFNGLYLEVQL